MKLQSSARLMSACRLAMATLVSLMSAANAHAGLTEIMSVDSEGRRGVAQGDGIRWYDDDLPYSAAISADGRYVAFYSRASTLVPGDTNDVGDVFLHDRLSGKTSRVSVDSTGQQANAGSYQPAISADGRYVAFVSGATNLVVENTNSVGHVFVHDSLTGATTRVSVSDARVQANGYSWGPSISADGRYVAYVSQASNLVPGDTNRFHDVFVHDRETGRTTRVSVSSDGMQARPPGGWATDTRTAVSADGRIVAFSSYGMNLVPNDTNDEPDVFVHDRQTGRTTRVSVSSTGAQGNNPSGFPSLSADGRYVAFHSDAENLVPDGYERRIREIYVHDRQTAATTRVSVSSSGERGNSYENSGQPSLSADGRYVAFHSWAPNLVAGDTNGRSDIFLRDIKLGVTTRISVDSGGNQSDNQSFGAVLSADSRSIAFASNAFNLVAGDTLGSVDFSWDTFVHDRLTNLREGPTGQPSCVDGLDNDHDGYQDAEDTECKPVTPPLLCEGRRATIVGGPGNDNFVATPGDDIIAGGSGDDVIDGVGGNDAICGGFGDDTLSGGIGNDRLFGGPGDDSLQGGSGNDQLFGSSGADQLSGGAGTDACSGQSGTDTHLGGCEAVSSVP